jgi:hypothetical protein
LLLLGVLSLGVTIGYSRVSCTPPSPPPANAAQRAVPPDLFPEARRRTEDSTYLTFPEWHIVYSAEEYATWLESHPPSGFPYFQYVSQFWCGYNSVFELTRSRYPFNAGNHLMLMVIGTSQSAEFAIKGVYEGTIGRATEALSNSGDTDEDRFAKRVAADYGQFLNQIPWYEYPFSTRLSELWSETSLSGDYPIRKWERRLALSLEYGAKAGYGWLLGLATGAVYDADAVQVLVWAEDLPVLGTPPPATPPPAGSPADAADTTVQPFISLERQVDGSSALYVLPRFTAFRNTLQTIPSGQGRLLAVAGNQEMMITAIAPREWNATLSEGHAVFEQPILIDPARKRVAIVAPVSSLLSLLSRLQDQSITIEHVYDY